MRLAVFSHKVCWPSDNSPSGYATDGGFAFQIGALSELFESTVLVVPFSSNGNHRGEVSLAGRNLSIAPLSVLSSSDLRRKLGFPLWLLGNFPTIIREMRRADAVHAPIPGDVGTVGMLLAFILRKPLFVRHCGNWFVQRTVAERFCKSFMERFAGNRNVFLATGGASDSPSRRNAAIRWIFSTTLTERDLEACRTQRDGPDHGCLRLIIACRQEREKGTGVVIESLPLLLRDFPRATLDVVGDGSALPEFKQVASSLGVSGRITFHGKVAHAEVMRLLKHAHVLCYPTRSSEGFPKIVHEALACGLPVVTTHVSVLPHLIGSGSGYLIEEVTPDAVARAVRQCVADEETYCAMSVQALETAQHYSLERWREAIGELLRKAWGPLHSDV